MRNGGVHLECCLAMKALWTTVDHMSPAVSAILKLGCLNKFVFENNKGNREFLLQCKRNPVVRLVLLGKSLIKFVPWNFSHRRSRWCFKWCSYHSFVGMPGVLWHFTYDFLPLGTKIWPLINLAKTMWPGVGVAHLTGVRIWLDTAQLHTRCNTCNCSL